MTTKLFIIGNGFDLHHNIRCKYSDFAAYLENKDHATYDTAVNYVVPESDLWSCLEERLAEIDVDQIEEYAQNFLVPYGADNWSDAYHHDYEYEIEQICTSISHRLRSHFAEWARQIEIPLQTLKPVRCIDPEALFLNFNYTDTLQTLYGVADSRILHIHGAASNPTDQIVLGHGWEQKASDLRSRFSDEETDVRVAGGFHLIDELLARTFKPTQEILRRNNAFFEGLSSVTEVFVLGHSMAQVDGLYFKAVLENVDPNARWIISSRGDGSKARIAANSIGISASKIGVRQLKNL